jgi:pimeloyl-ACP methyl ester carboxylesterase
MRQRSGRFRIPPVPVLARLVAEWIRALDRGSVALIGHSMGGQISIHIAGSFRHLVHRLVLVNSTGAPRALRPAELIRIGRGFLPPGAWGAPAFLTTIGLDTFRAGPAGLLTALHSLLRDDVRPLLPHIAAPTAVIWGELDPFLPVTDGWMLTRHISGARLHLLPGAAHNPMIDRPESFNPLLLEILAGRHD